MSVRKKNRTNLSKAKNEEFRQAALQFPQDVIIAGEMLRITPEVLKP